MIAVLNAIYCVGTDCSVALHVIMINTTNGFGGHYQAVRYLSVSSCSYLSNRCHYLGWYQGYPLTTPCFYLHPDPKQPFLKTENDLDTIFVTRFSTHVSVPCLVTVPDLNVTLLSLYTVSTQQRFSHTLFCLIEAVK